MSAPGKDFVYSQGVDTATNAAADKTILGAPGAGQYLHLERAMVSVVVAAVGGAGEVVLEDGLNGTKLWRADADAVGSYIIDFGNRGYRLTANTLLNLTVEGAATTQATAICSAVAHVAPDGY